MDGSLSQPTLKKNEESELQSLNNIQQLQAMEKELYSKLEYNVANNVNVEEQTSIIKKINELSQLRINLFKTIENIYGSVQSSIANSRVNLVDQLTVVGVVENELNNAKKQLNLLESNKHNKMRMVEINTYYGKRYKAHTLLVKKLIFICIPLLIIAILKKKDLIPAIIPDMAIYGVSALIVLVGGYSLIHNIVDINSRDNMDYDAYNWNFNPESQKPSVYEYNKAQLLGATDSLSDLGLDMGFACVGAKCCSEGMTYDETARKCIKSVAKETFVTGQLTGGVFNGANDTVYMGTSEPEPYTAGGMQFASTV